MNDNRYIAVIGCGYWGKNLVRNFYELGVLNAICDKDINTLEQLRVGYPGIKAASDFGTILGSADIKAIAIATPAVTHYDLAKKAILAGKDVFVEKPLAMNTQEAGELVALAQKKDRVLMVGHILQYHPAAVKLKELITSGELGTIQYIYSNRLNIGKLRTEENILWSFAPHDLSLILMLVEEEPQMITAFGGDYINRGVYDITLTTLHFKNGAKAHIFVSWLHPYKEQRLIVVGSKNMAVFDDLTDEKLFIYPHRIEWKEGGIPIAHKAEHNSVPVEKKEPLKEELRHFIDCIITRAKPKTDGYEGLRVLRILESAEKYFIRSKHE